MIPVEDTFWGARVCVLHTFGHAILRRVGGCGLGQFDTCTVRAGLGTPATLGAAVPRNSGGA